MINVSVTVGEVNGVHARPAGAIVTCAKRYASEVTIRKNGSVADGKRLIAVMGLGARHGDVLEFSVSGKDEESAAEDLKRVCRDNIG